MRRLLPRLRWKSFLEVDAKCPRLKPASHTCPSCTGLNGVYSLLTSHPKMLFSSVYHFLRVFVTTNTPRVKDGQLLRGPLADPALSWKFYDTSCMSL